jgi:hypothetical protein
MKGTAISVSESNGVSDGVGCRQTLLFRFYEGPRRALVTRLLDLYLVACFIFFFCVASRNFCKVNSLFSKMFQYDGLALGSGLAQG